MPGWYEKNYWKMGFKCRLYDFLTPEAYFESMRQTAALVAEKKGGNVHGWFDALNPEFNWSYTKEELKEWFVEEGFSNIKLGDMKFNINMNGILK